MIDKETHDKEHDSLYDPKPDCEHCVREVYRRTHRCFGDGFGTISLPITHKEE